MYTKLQLANITLYSIEGEYLALSTDRDYAALPSQQDMLTCVFTRGYLLI